VKKRACFFSLCDLQLGASRDSGLWKAQTHGLSYEMSYETKQPFVYCRERVAGVLKFDGGANGD
jgi:hypothetical protein